jgi:cytochrome c-type biogenesis protein
MHSPGIIIAFLAGMLSIASPCILPILPSFLGYITGVSLSHTYRNHDKKTAIRKLMLNTLCFGIGFSMVFMIFGAVIGTIGQIFLLNRPVFQTIGGIIIIFFGLQLTGLINLNFMRKEKKIEMNLKLKRGEYLRSFLIGVFFAFGWAPCYGPIIGAIFTLAATGANFWEAVMLFSFYSLGLLIPLLLFTFVIAHTSQKLKQFQKIAQYSSAVAGVFVIFLGVLLMTNNLGTLVNWIDVSYNMNNISLL